MTTKEIVVEAMKQKNFNQGQLATAAGLKRQSNVSEMLRSSSMSVDNFSKLLSAMGFEVVVRDKQTNEILWTIENGTQKELNPQVWTKDGKIKLAPIDEK